MTSVTKGGKKYSAPKLIHYGDMVAMTAAGSGAMAEAIPGMGSMTRHP